MQVSETATKSFGVENLLRDANGNVASVQFFGSYAKAYEALKSLKNCINCENCENCIDCANCTLCANCKNCSGCFKCSQLEASHRCAGIRDDSGREDVVSDDVIPKIENIHQTVYKMVIANKEYFDMNSWHGMTGDSDPAGDAYCGTHHCRAGWVATLAGFENKPIERILDTQEYAKRIYKKSGYEIADDFQFTSSSNEMALADMKHLAELEAKGQAPARDPMLSDPEA